MDRDRDIAMGVRRVLLSEHNWGNRMSDTCYEGAILVIVVVE
jgi:hypothetical protein